MPTTRQLDIEISERKADAVPRRFPVSVSSETPIQRRDRYGEVWSEVLSHAAGAVNLERQPLPVLEGHDRSKVNIGHVTGLRIDGAKLRGELVLGASQRAMELAADISGGIIRSLSVGFTIDEETRDEKNRRITATRWTPYEVSLVACPADSTVGVNRSHDMPKQTPTPTEPITLELENRAAVLAERERVEFIHGAARRHPAAIDRDFAQNLIDKGTPFEMCSTAILNRLADYSDALPPIRNHVPHDAAGDYDALRGGRRQLENRDTSPITAGSDFADDFRAAAVDALLIRSGIPVAKPHAAAGDVSGSVLDLARLCLSRAGKSSRGLFGGEARGTKLIERAANTGDFPAILTGALHAAVRNGYEMEPASHRAWVRTAPVVDFRDQERPILGSAPALEKVLEGAEYTHGYMNEDSAKYAVAKYGKIVALTWEVLVNDRLGTFLRVQPGLGQAARRLEADIVYTLLAENAGAGPTMQDGVALFHAASHGNLATAGAFDAALLSAGRALLRKMTALSGGYLSIVPRFLIVPAERETAAEILLANATRRMTTAKAEPEWIASLQLVVEPRLANTAAYLAADSSQIDLVELGLLEENMNGPVIDEEEEFGRDEKRWKVRHVFGAKVLDWRGMVRLPITG